MSSLNSYIFANESHVKKEKAKTRLAKKSRWWHEKRNRGVCHYCQESFLPQDLTMDHIVPIARGGTTTPGNVVPACRPCNQKKGVDTPVDLILSKLD